MNTDPSFDLILLDPAKVSLFRTGGDAVRATITDPQLGAERTYVQVQVARAFPLSLPESYIGLRDAKDKDIGMLVTLEGLDPESRRLLDDELARRYFLPKITRVLKVKKEFDTVNWEVETDKGPRKFVVHNLKDSVHQIPRGPVLITDRTGARYEIPDLAQLPGDAVALLMRVL